MTLHEPATFVTDLLLAALGTWLALRLRSTSPASPARNWWIAAISLMATSALAGGFYHGFSPEVPAAVEAWWWRNVLWIICGLGFAMGMSLLREFNPAANRAWCLVAVNPEFIVAMADYGSAMLAWTLVSLLSRRPWRAAMLAGMGLSFLAALVQQMQWGLTARFNHNDLFHVVQAMALFAFYRAGRCLDAPVGSVPAINALPSPDSSPG
jgi:hypothetical protein